MSTDINLSTLTVHLSTKCHDSDFSFLQGHITRIINIRIQYLINIRNFYFNATQGTYPYEFRSLIHNFHYFWSIWVRCVYLSIYTLTTHSRVNILMTGRGRRVQFMSQHSCTTTHWMMNLHQDKELIGQYKLIELMGLPDLIFHMHHMSMQNTMPLWETSIYLACKK